LTPPRRIGPEAAPALAPLHARAFAPGWSRSALAQMIASPGVLALAASPAGEAEDALAGFILVRAVAGEAEVLTLAVEPGARRTGVGRTLVEAACDLASDAGAQTLWLEVAVDNAAARALYAAAGFEPMGARRGYYARPEGRVDALVLRRALRSPA